MNKNVKDAFSFSKKELNGLLVFAVLLVLMALAPVIYSFFVPPQVYDHAAFEKEINAFMASATKKENDKFRPFLRDELENREMSGELFSFNPNNLSVTDWQRLGLSAKQIKVIKNFESKGGRFYRKEDLKKIYSIRGSDYERLEPFIAIPEKKNGYKSRYEKNTYKKPDAKLAAVVNLNSADSAQLESLNGIGPAFAARIIKYRNRLGGFCRKEQLKEVYGIDSVVYQKLVNRIVVYPDAVKQISINTATFDELRRHPYLTYKQMNAIIQYRKQHGSYKDLDGLRPIAILNETILNKLAPYLSFDPN